MSKSPDEHKQILREIEQKSDEFAKRACELSECIVAYENWLNRLPGRVQADAWLSLDEQTDNAFGIQLARQGKRWALSFAYGVMDSDEQGEWRPLVEASIEDKLIAISMFPKLLEAIREEQVSKIERVKSTQAKFAEFAKAIGIQPGGN